MSNRFGHKNRLRRHLSLVIGPRSLVIGSAPFAPRPAPRARRSGISLLEVLISIFVISIGLLGVAAMLPLAQHMANRGATADRAAVSGRDALHQFLVREMNNPDNWLSATGVHAALSPYNPDGSPNTDWVNSPLNPVGGRAFCIDPRLVVRDPTAATFPRASGAAPSMPRLTLWDGIKGPVTNPKPNPMSALEADEIFTLQDDLEFEIPDDAAQLPMQKYIGDNNGTPNDPTDDIAEKRYSSGDFSWLATLVREGAGDRYTLSVVITYKRHDPTLTTPPENQEVNIPGAPNTYVTVLGGVGGGEVTVTHASASNPNLVAGNWVMLSAENATAGFKYFRWYRIVQSSDVDSSSGTPSRQLTLAGRDWNMNFPNPQLTIVPRVVDVYERTIRLETGDPWQR